jgi:hypothetical protein
MIGARRAGVRYLGVVVVSVIALNLYTPLSTASAAVSPATCKCTVTLHPASGGRGASVSVTGSGFTPNATVTLEFVDATLGRISLAPSHAGHLGNFATTIRIPAAAAFGHGYVVANTGALRARDGFLVTKECSTTAKITRSPASGQRNSSVDVSGTGFCPSTRVRIRFRDANLNWTTLAVGVPIANDGTFSATAKVPSDAALGDGYLTVHDASSHQDAKALFTVRQ